MLTGKNVVIFGSVIATAFVLQVILLSVSKVDSPAGVAVEFTKAYFMLDGPSMEELLCSELSEDDLKKITNDVQKLTDSSIEKIDEILKNKKEDILKV